MTKIEISEEIKKKLPQLVLGCIECDVMLKDKNEELWLEIEEVGRSLRERMELSDISSHPAIAASRRAYRVCGKDPARYRLSSEALMRRVVKNLDLYRINNVVDLVNLVSLKTGMSIGGFDAEQIQGEVTFGLGKEQEPYHAIGRGELNIDCLPVFRDTVSSFGSPTSDSVRTCVTEKTKRFLMVIIGFSGEQATTAAMELAHNLLLKYAGAQNYEQAIVW